MFAIERQNKIKEILFKEKRVDVSELSKLFEVTEVTIRRDLAKLEQDGFLIKTYGGAVLNEEAFKYATKDESEEENYNLAADFGASSGRLILSKFDGDKIELEEIHRFPDEPVRIGNRFYWDFPRLFHELKNGLKKAALKGIDISGIGIDTWGVDYGLKHGIDLGYGEISKAAAAIKNVGFIIDPNCPERNKRPFSRQGHR